MKNHNKIYILLLMLHIAAGCARPAMTSMQVADDMQLIRISPGVYMHISVYEMGKFGKISSNGMVYVNDGEAFLVDTPVSEAQTEKLVDYIENSLQARVSGFLATHWHGDCMGGLAYLQEKGIPSYAHQLTISIAKEKGLPVPEHGFDDSLVLNLKGAEIECHWLGGGHATDNIVAWIPAEHILFGGCLVKDMASRDLGNISDADLDAWPETIARVQDKFASAKIIIPGHGQFGGAELLAHTKKLLSEKNN